MIPHRFQGVVTPLLTPFDAEGRITDDLYLAHAADMLAGGSHYLSPFGTTGEALSVPVAARMAALERLIDTGTARPGQLMPGTGLCSLADTIELTRHAVALDVAAVMVLPPFFLPKPSDDGLFRHYAALIEALAGQKVQVCLYHIPQNTGVPISPALTARLAKTFPGIVTAYKDSSGDWGNTQAVIDAAPDVAVFPASEAVLPKAIAAGAAGCISASCNANIRAIRALFDHLRAGETEAAEALMPQIRAVRSAAEGAGLIPGLKSFMAAKTGDARWRTTLPPLLDAPEALPEAMVDLARS